MEGGRREKKGGREGTKNRLCGGLSTFARPCTLCGRQPGGEERGAEEGQRQRFIHIVPLYIVTSRLCFLSATVVIRPNNDQHPRKQDTEPYNGTRCCPFPISLECAQRGGAGSAWRTAYTPLVTSLQHLPAFKGSRHGQPKRWHACLYTYMGGGNSYIEWTKTEPRWLPSY